MKSPRTLFSIVVWLGIVANWSFAAVVLLYSYHAMQNLLGMDTPGQPAIWLYNYSVLLALLSCFYIPAARDPLTYRANAWLLVFCRLIPATTFFIGVAAGMMPSSFLVLGIGDGTFGVVQLVLLVRLLRQAQQPSF